MEGDRLAPLGCASRLAAIRALPRRPCRAVLCVGDAGAPRGRARAAVACPLVAVAALAATGARGLWRIGGWLEGARIMATLGLRPVYGHALALM